MFKEEMFRNELSCYGDLLLVVVDDMLVKVYIYVEEFGNVFNFVQCYGDLIKIKIENMREQYIFIIS